MCPVTASTAFLATIPSPPQGVWEIGPFPIRAYALFTIIGIVVAIWWGQKRLEARGGAAGTVVDVAMFAVPFGVIGGRVYHVITDYHLYFGEGKDPVRALYVWEGGLGIWGAIALGAVGAWLGCKRKGLPLPVFADAVAPAIAVAHAIARIGNYFNQELYGAHTTLPWGLEIYQRVNARGEADQLNGISNGIPLPESPVHPTFLYELLWNLGVAALVVYVDRKQRLGHGRAFALYVAAYTLGRTWIELMRTDPATPVFGVRVNVWVSILLFVGALTYFFLARKKGSREVLGETDKPTETAPPSDTKPDDGLDNGKEKATINAKSTTPDVAQESRPED